jgi:hypothetical protein
MRDKIQSSSSSVGITFLARPEAGFDFFDAGLVTAVFGAVRCSPVGGERLLYGHDCDARHTFRFLVSGSEASSSSAGISSISSAKSSPDSSVSCKVHQA